MSGLVSAIRKAHNVLEAVPILTTCILPPSSQQEAKDTFLKLQAGIALWCEDIKLGIDSVGYTNQSRFHQYSRMMPSEFRRNIIDTFENAQKFIKSAESDGFSYPNLQRNLDELISFAGEYALKSSALLLEISETERSELRLLVSREEADGG